jgi:hypothetical protein
MGRLTRVALRPDFFFAIVALLALFLLFVVGLYRMRPGVQDAVRRASFSRPLWESRCRRDTGSVLRLAARVKDLSSSVEASARVKLFLAAWVLARWSAQAAPILHDLPEDWDSKSANQISRRATKKAAGEQAHKGS